MKKLVATTAVIATLLAGCGGGGGGTSGGVQGGENPTNPSPQVQTGVLHDSPVTGVSYSTPTQSGITNALGQFEYLEGEMITFRIGDFVLGQTAGASIVIPMALKSAAGQTVDPILSLQFLQTLDADNNPANGITIPPAAYPAGQLVDLVSEEAAQTYLTSANVATPLVSAPAAVEHFMSTIDAVANTGLAPSSTTAPLSYTKLRAVVGDRDPVDPSMPDPACSLGNVGTVTVNRSAAVWSPESVTVSINQKDFLLPWLGHVVFEDDTAKVEFMQPKRAMVATFVDEPLSFLDGYASHVKWMATGFQYYDDGMGVVTYRDKATGCDYRILVKDAAWYAQRANLPPRSQLSPSIYKLDGCLNGTVTPLDGSASYCAGDTGDKWFTYFTGAYDPDGYVSRTDWQVDLAGSAWVNGTCSADGIREGKIVRNEGMVIWTCDDHSQVSLRVHLNWLNPMLAQGYPGHSVTVTPYDNNLLKGAPSTITVPGKDAPQSSLICALVTYDNGDSHSWCVNNESFTQGMEFIKSGSTFGVTTFNGGCETNIETYSLLLNQQFSIVISNSTCTPNSIGSYTYSDGIFEFTGENYPFDGGLVDWCSTFNLYAPAGGFCQIVPSVVIPSDLPPSMGNQTVTPSCSGGQVAVGSSCQCPAGETLESGVCVAAPLTGNPDAQGCFLVDPNKLAIDTVRGPFFLGEAKVTLTNSSSLRVVAEVQFTGGGAADKGQVSIPGNGTNRWTGGESSLTGYQVEFWGSTTPANDWVCHKPEFTQIKSGSL